jgi:predicted secreted protein
MNLVFALAIYFVCWWIILFAILPFGVTTQQEAGEVSPGTSESAPVAPKLIPKLIATTIASAIIFAFIYWLMEGGVVTLDNIPFLPRFEDASRMRP